MAARRRNLAPRAATVDGARRRLRAVTSRTLRYTRLGGDVPHSTKPSHEVAPGRPFSAPPPGAAIRAARGGAGAGGGDEPGSLRLGPLAGPLNRGPVEVGEAAATGRQGRRAGASPPRAWLHGGASRRRCCWRGGGRGIAGPGCPGPGTAPLHPKVEVWSSKPRRRPGAARPGGHRDLVARIFFEPPAGGCPHRELQGYGGNVLSRPRHRFGTRGGGKRRRKCRVSQAPEPRRRSPPIVVRPTSARSLVVPPPWPTNHAPRQYSRSARSRSRSDSDRTDFGQHPEHSSIFGVRGVNLRFAARWIAGRACRGSR